MDGCARGLSYICVLLFIDNNNKNNNAMASTLSADAFRLILGTIKK